MTMPSSTEAAQVSEMGQWGVLALQYVNGLRLERMHRFATIDNPDVRRYLIRAETGDFHDDNQDFGLFQRGSIRDRWQRVGQRNRTGLLGDES